MCVCVLALSERGGGEREKRMRTEAGSGGVEEASISREQSASLVNTTRFLDFRET